MLNISFPFLQNLEYFNPSLYAEDASEVQLLTCKEAAPSAGMKWFLSYDDGYVHPANQLATDAFTPSLRLKFMVTDMRSHRPPGWSAVERVATCQSPDLGCLKRDILSGTTAACPSPYILPPLATITGWLRGFVFSQQESTIEPRSP